MPGIRVKRPCVYNTAVRMAPAHIAGHRPQANFRPGPFITALALRAFRMTAQAPIPSARAASPIQRTNHCWKEDSIPATIAVMSAVTPITAPPHPGTAVKDPARSIVSRM